jgi:trigger factor
METTLEKITATNGKLTVQVLEADYKPEVDKKLKQYTKTALIKGFRPGHVPASLIQKMYGKSIMVDEVINMVSKQVGDYLKENKVRTVGEPLPNQDEASRIDWDNQKEFSFVYDLGIASDFTVDLDVLPAVKLYDIEPADARIDESLADMRMRFGKTTHPEEAEVGDIAFGKLTQASTEFLLETGIPTDKLSEESANKFKGLEKGSVLAFDIQTIFDSVKSLSLATSLSEEEAAKMQGEFSFEVTDITRTEPADIDQEFFDKVLGEGKVTDIEGLRAEIRTIIKENYAREAGFLMEFETEKTLLNNIPIELPDEFLKNWLIQINEGKFEMEVIEKDYPAFARGLRMDLIRNEIATENKIEVVMKDVEEEAAAEYRGYFGGGGFEGMDEMIDKMVKRTLQENKDNVFQKYFNAAFSKKVLGFLKTKLKVETQTIPVEDFNKIAEATYGIETA